MGSKRLLIIAAGAVLFASVSLAQARATNQTDEAARADNAANVLSEIMEAPDQGIPEAL